jgi:hypothetical protein
MKTAMSPGAWVNDTLPAVDRVHRNSDGSDPFSPRGTGASRWP